MFLFLSLAVTVAIHLFLGWEWTILGGILCGWLVSDRAWLKGAIAVGGAWGVQILIDWLAAPGPVGTMLHTVGQILGNMPAALVVGVTIAIGCLLGYFGGLIGSLIKGIGQ